MLRTAMALLARTRADEDRSTPSISKTCTAWPNGGCRRSRSILSRAGSRTSAGSKRNTSAFHKHQLLPRYLVDVSKRDQTQTIFGQTFASPFGISPTGGAGLFRRGADLMLAEAAADANIPYIMSGAEQRFDRGGGPGRAEQCLVSALRGARRRDHRGPDPPRRRLPGSRRWC